MLKSLFYELIARIERQRNELSNYQLYPEFYRFKMKTEDSLHDLKMKILYEIQSDNWMIPNSDANFYSSYQQKSEKVMVLEYYRVQVLNKCGNTEIFFYLLTKLLLKQFRVSATPPMISSGVSSRKEDYFWAETHHTLIGVPPGEDFHFINLPDLIHELAHIIIDYVEVNENGITGNIRSKIEEFYKKELWSIEDNNNPSKVKLLDKVTKWQDNWLNNWLIEFCCDMMATYFVGPAYAWTNLKLSLSEHPEDVYEINSKNHPSHEARMRAINEMLRCSGFGNSVQEISMEWKRFLDIHGNREPVNYELAFPDELIEDLANTIYSKCKEHGYLSYEEQLKKLNNPISEVMNEAWDILRNNSADYGEWEKQKLEKIKAQINYTSECGRKT